MLQRLGCIKTALFQYPFVPDHECYLSEDMDNEARIYGFDLVGLDRFVNQLHEPLYELVGNAGICQSGRFETIDIIAKLV